MATEPDPALAAAAAVARSIRRLTVLAWTAVIVAVVVLAIDQQIKAAVIQEAQRARAVLDEFKSIVLEGLAGGTEAEQGTAGDGDRPDGGDDLVHAPRPSAAVDPDADSAGPAKGGGPGRAPGRPRRDG